MHLLQILLPLCNEEKKPFPQNVYSQIRSELKEHFGGITAFTRSPATGLWKEDNQRTVEDQIIIYEVMAPVIDRQFWMKYKENLERIFQQEEIVIRFMNIEVL